MFPFLLFALPAAAFLFLTRAQRDREAREGGATHSTFDVPQQTFAVQPGERWALTISASPVPKQEVLQTIMQKYAEAITKGGDAYILSANLVPAAGTFAVALQYQRPGVVNFGMPIPVGAYTLKIVNAQKL